MSNVGLVMIGSLATLGLLMCLEWALIRTKSKKVFEPVTEQIGLIFLAKRLKKNAKVADKNSTITKEKKV